MKQQFIITLLIFNSVYGFSQNPIPASPQEKRILFLNGTLHSGNGTVINSSALAFANGKLNLVADATLIRINRTEYDTVIDISGSHIYPGLIAINTTIGINEIEAVRATNDFAETGSLNPSVRSIVAYNTDSRVIPTVRSNGVLIAQVVPQGGLISGMSSVVQLDAWNFEDAVYKNDIGLHLNWPSMRTSRSRDAEADEKNKIRAEKSLAEIRKLFADAKAYSENPPLESKNIHLESMRGLFDGSKKLFVHCDYVKEIIAAVGFCAEYKIQMVLVGGNDAWMVTDLLRRDSIPVVISQTHRVPSRDDEDVDLPYKLPTLLKNAGVEFAISVPKFWQVRNLCFQAGTSASFGLTREEALSSITSSAAKILGVDQTLGTLEVGKDATFIISKGDLLDMRTSDVDRAFIQGRAIDLDNMQKQLDRKFRGKYGLK